MSSILEEIETKIAGLKTSTTKSNVGVVRETGDGVARIEGLSDVMLNEMIEFPNGVFGLALNLEETEVGAILLGDPTKISEGDEVKTTGRLLSGAGRQRRCSAASLTRSANRSTTKARSRPKHFIRWKKLRPASSSERSVSQPVQTGIMAIDAMIPIGRGQRELIIGDRATGKTTIAIDTIISQARLNKAAEEEGDKDYRPLYCIYVAIGQKNSNVARALAVLEREGAMPYTTIISAPASDTATNQYLAPFAGAAMGEWFMDNGMDALIIYDDLSKHAVAYRQVSLVLKRPSGREAYPGDVFYLHSRLLERSARVSDEFGGGSLTALPIIETQAGDVSAYIPTNVISITDGQIYLETDLVLPRRAAGDFGRSLGEPRRFGRADQGDQASRRQSEARPRAVPRAGGVRAVRFRSRCGDQSATRSRSAHRRVVQAEAIQSDPGRRTGRGDVGDAEWIISTMCRSIG